MSSTTVYLLALAANLFFSTASLVFSMYAKKFSPFWINQFKVAVAILLFGFATVYTGWAPVSVTALGFLFLSGAMGLCIGDLFLFRAYATLGAGRSLVLFSFQPLILGVYGWFALGQHFTLSQMGAVACMMACLGVFLLERNKFTGHWDLKSFFWAFTGIILDAGGVMLTRSAYENSPALDSMQVNLIRCTGALVAFFIWKPRGIATVTKDFIAMKTKEKALVMIACICGTFVSLSLYLAALKYAHVASLTAVAITGPVWVAILECIWEKKWPNVYLVSAFGFFILGFYLMA
ncbi:MAG: DMT family transporter [Bacteriovoracaceae bacterium]|nr:DMT family transporter [Bacteriovoracaceae bacterium]